MPSTEDDAGSDPLREVNERLQWAPSFEGRRYFEWVDDIRQLQRDGKLIEAERILLGIIAVIEAHSAKTGEGVAPWYYERLAIIYRKQGAARSELWILEAYEAQKKAPGARPAKIAARLAKLRARR